MELLRVAVVARLLGVSTKRVYQLLEVGRLQSLRFGPRTLRIPKSSVEKLILDRLNAERSERGHDLPPGGRRQPWSNGKSVERG